MTTSHRLSIMLGVAARILNGELVSCCASAHRPKTFRREGTAGLTSGSGMPLF